MFLVKKLHVIQILKLIFQTLIIFLISCQPDMENDQFNTRSKQLVH